MQNNQRRYRKKYSPDTEKILGKQLPASLPAESAVLGNLLLNDNKAIDVIEELNADDFYSPANQMIFEAMSILLNNHKRIDLITVQDQLGKMDKLESSGGVEYLITLQENLLQPGIIMQHVKLVKEKAVLRSLIDSATEIITNCYSQDETLISEVLDKAEKTIFAISQKRASRGFRQLNICIASTIKHLAELEQNHGGVIGISTGFKGIDAITSGFQKGELTILAARPAQGKSALGLSMALSAACCNFSVGFLSIEMEEIPLITRLLSSWSGVPKQKISDRNLTSDEWLQVTNAAAAIEDKQLHIDDTGVETILDLRTKARKLKIEKNIDMLVIDYLQLIPGAGKYDNRNQEVADISRALKALAKELKIPILALAQLSRSLENRTDKRPILSDLRDSGAIEQDADVVMFLHRDVYYTKENCENPESAELIIGKHRNGALATVPLRFIGELTRFEDAPDNFY